MKKILLTLTVAFFSTICFSQLLTRDIHCTLTYGDGYSHLEFSKFAKSLPDSLSNAAVLRSVTRETLATIFDEMENSGWQLVTSAGNDFRTLDNRYLNRSVFVFKKAIYYSTDMVEDLQQKKEREEAIYKYYPD